MGYKLKTHKGAAKRFKITAKGKVKFKRSFTGHLMSGKGGDRKRRLRQPAYLSEIFARKVRAAIA